MTSRFVLEATRDFAARLRARFGSRLLWVRLYGSQARGDAYEESDVDVLAVVRELTWREKVEGIDLGFDVSSSLGLRISPVVMAESDFARLVEVESAFAQNVLREGIVT